MARMANVTWDGLRDLLLQLEGLGPRITEQAQEITNEVARQVADDIVQIYPEDTGNLRRGVRVKKGRAQGLEAVTIVTSTAPHAHLYEYGTAVRSFGSQDRGQMFVRNPAARTASRSDRVSLSGRPVVSSISGRPAMAVVGTRASIGRQVLRERLKALVRRETGAEVVDE